MTFGVLKSGFLAALIFLVASARGQDPGFFLNDHTARTAIIPSFTEVAKPATAPDVTVTADFSEEITPVSRYLFGNNANPYMTQMVTEPVLLDHITNLSPNIIRFPGGNLSSVYFWNTEKNVPPGDAPTTILNGEGQSIDPGYWYGKNEEGWTLSVDNYYEMLDRTNSTGMITVNYGYARYGLADDPVAAAAHLAADWVRYDNGRTRFWEIGNESNGSWQAGFRIKVADNKDGQPAVVTGALYGKHFRVFADSMRKAADEIGATIYIGAQLLQEAPASWWTETDRFWNDGVFDEAGDEPDYYIIHSYYTPYAQNSTASVILNSADAVTTDMMEYVTSQMEDAGVTPKPVALTEWNIFAEGSKQMVSYINGMHAAIVLGELIRNKYGMASRWDLANGWNNGNDHGMFSQGDQPNVTKWSPRPAFFYMYYFQKFFGDTMVKSTVQGNSNVLAYASSFSSGETGYVIVNKESNSRVVSVLPTNKGFGGRYYYYTLTGGTDNGEFSLKVMINGTGPSASAGGPAGYATIQARSASVEGGIKISAPARSVTYVLVEDGSDVVTSVDEEETKRFAYPNPTSGRLHISGSPYDEHLQIIDARGVVVFAKTLSRSSDVTELQLALPDGLYLLRRKGGSREQIQKIIIAQSQSVK